LAARWMLWQAYRERGEREAAQTALSALTKGLLRHPNRAWISGLGNLITSWLREGDVLAAEELSAQYRRLVTAWLEPQPALEKVAAMVGLFWRADPLYAQALTEQSIRWILGWTDPTTALIALRHLGHHCFDLGAGPPARSTFLAIREKYGQEALTAEEQWHLAATYEPPLTWDKTTEVEDAVKEYLLLLQKYPGFAQKDRVGLRLIALLAHKQDLAAAEAVGEFLQRVCPASPATLEVQSLLKAMRMGDRTSTGGIDEKR